MTIEKGKEWGRPGPLAGGGVVVGSDSAARAALEEALSRDRPLPPLGLLGGDLCRTLGGRGDEARLHSAQAMTFTVDLGRAVVDGRQHVFLAHLVARNRLWTRAFVAMNAQWHGRWNLGPRAHPNDGLLDTYDVRLALSDLARVRPRLPHGAHLPHPGVRERRSAAVEVELERPLAVFVDGVRVGRGQALSVRVAPDAVTVVV